MVNLSQYDIFEVNEERLEYYTEVRIKFDIDDRTFLLSFDKEAALSERTLSMNCELYEIYYMETPEDIEVFGSYIEVPLDREDVEEILSEEFEQHVIDLVETLSD